MKLSKRTYNALTAFLVVVAFGTLVATVILFPEQRDIALGALITLGTSITIFFFKSDGEE